MTIKRQLSQRKLKTTTDIIAFGNPSYGDSHIDELPFSENEINSIIDIFDENNVILYQGIDATESNFKKIDYSHTNILHIATHGISYEQNPGKSALILGSDNPDEGHSRIHSEEIFNYNIPADLVFLSACKSGTGGSFPCEGVLSLSQPFLVAGSNSEIVSYWNINDRCSAEIVKCFYKKLKVGFSKSQSLARAKRDFIKHKRTAWNHPYYWAPFIYTGLDN